MARYIDAERLKMTLASGVRVYDGMCRTEDIFHTINNEPTADVVEVKHGYWKHTVEKGTTFNHHFFTCSLCGASAFISGYEKYCHNCGAKMDERKDAE